MKNTMRLVAKQFTGIAMLTALEASRQPIFLLLTSSVIIFIGLLPLLITHVIGESSRMVRDSALAIQFVSGLILGCYAATSTITRELRKGTLASILSKPVNRSLFFFAKFSGVSLIMVIYALITTLATMLSVRTAAITFSFDWWGIGPLLVSVALSFLWAGIENFKFRTPFVSRAYSLLTIAVILAFVISCFISAEFNTIGHSHGHSHTLESPSSSAIPWNILPAGILIGLSMILLSAFSVSLAIHFDTVPTCSICLGIFLLGLMSDFLFGQQADSHWFFAFLHGLLPNWQHFWAVDALVGGSIPWAYTFQVTGYVIVYTAVVLSAGLLTFSRMEVT